MKRLISFILTLFLLLASAAVLLSCTEDDADNTAYPTPEDIDDGKNVLKNELHDLSLSEALAMFERAVADADFRSLLGEYAAQISLPADSFSGSSELSLTLNEGVLIYDSEGSVRYLGVSDSGLLSVTQGGDGYVLEEKSFGENLNTGTAISYLRQCISLAEEYFDLSDITKDDITYSDGTYYLNDEYMKQLCRGVYSAAFCLSVGKLPSELTEAELSELSVLASDLETRIEAHLGFVLKMKRIMGIKLSVSAGAIGEYTDGTVKTVLADLYVGLDSGRTYPERTELDLTTESVDGSLSNTEAQISCTLATGRLVNLDLSFKNTLSGGIIKTTESEQGTEVSVVGDREVSLKLAFALKAGGGLVLDFTTLAEPKSLTVPSGAELPGDMRSELLDPNTYLTELDLEAKTGTAGTGSVRLTLKNGSVSLTRLGAFSFAKSEALPSVPSEVKDLIYPEKTDE